MMRKISLKTVLWILIVMIVGRHFIMVRPGAFDAVLATITYPYSIFQRSVIMPLRSAYQQWIVHTDIANQYTAVILERNELLKELLEARAIEREYLQCKDIQDFKKRYNCDYMVPAHVIARRFTAHESVVLIDVGSTRGIKPDMVIVYKNFLLGRVAEVHSYYSKVVLLTDASCKVAAVCAHTGARGILQGVNNLKELSLEFVSHLQLLEDGDLLFSAGEGLVFPRGFCVGKIKAFCNKELSYSVTVEPLLDIATFDVCYVLSKGAEYKE